MNVYDMKLHDVLWLNLNNTEVLRVPGGWIYRAYDSATQHECLNSCFVPFSNQFIGSVFNKQNVPKNDDKEPTLEPQYYKSCG